MILILVALLFIACFTVAGFWLSSGIEWAVAWKELAPNLVAELFGLAVALVLAEIFVRRHRLNTGTRQVGPFVIRSLADAANMSGDIIKRMDYTPKEFFAVLSDYIEGQYDPIHIPSDFRDRLATAVKPLDLNTVTQAVDGAKKACSIIDRFAGSLDANHVLLAEHMQENWQKFATIRASEGDLDKVALAEAFLDAHDNTGDLLQAFGFKIAQ